MKLAKSFGRESSPLQVLHLDEFEVVSKRIQPTQERLKRALRYVLDKNEFLSPYGLRSISRFHRESPYVFHAGNQEQRVEYVPGEGTSYLFRGNSNWRGPIWFPINYLIIEALERYHHFYGAKFKVKCPCVSGNMVT